MEIKGFMRKMLPKVKNAIVTAGKVATGGACGAIVDTFAMPVGLAYYGAKKTGSDFKSLFKDRKYALWTTCIKDIAMTTFVPLAHFPVGFLFGAYMGGLDAKENGIKFSLENRDRDFELCSQIVNEATQ